DNANWLTATKSGSTITAAVNLSGLAAGTYTSTIIVSANGATNTPQTIPVSLTVAAATPAPTIAVSPASLSFTLAGGTPATSQQTIAVSNTGGGTLKWAASNNDQPWMWHDFTTNSVTVYVQSSGLAPGTYSGAITIWSDNAINAPKVVPVSLTVTAASAKPTIGFSPPSLSFTGTTGGSNPAAQSITVTNAGTGTLTWTVADNANWLTATKSGSTITAAVNLSGLAAGTYNGVITVAATGATNTPQSVPVSLVVSAPTTTPTIGLSPGSLAFSATQGGSNPSNQSVSITNTGTGTLTWSVTDNANWLTATKSGGSVVAGVSVAGLASGTYNAAITVSASGATNTPQTIPVSLTVAPAPVASPTITLTPTSFALTAQAGSTTVLNQTLTITNTGGGTFNWTVVDDSNWVVKNVGSGSGNGTVAISVNPTGLAAGTHTSMITVSASGATNTPQVVPVTLTVTAAPAQPTIGLTPTSVAFSGTTGGSNPAAQSITVTNAGTGTLTWTVADNANWLTATKSGSTITAAVNLSGLAAGTYNGVITVSATGATNTPQSVPVTLTVNASGSTTGSVTLTWNGNGEQDLEGYKVYRATSSGAYGAPIATINGNVTSYVASGLPKGTTYYFVVTAYDNTGNESSYSNEVSKSVY
ncbi:MAG: fibronectin type III domain-containing protein, partial [Nitrospiraceae bacterium]